jgi:serine/threonine-protein kinase RsbW
MSDAVLRYCNLSTVAGEVQAFFADRIASANGAAPDSLLHLQLAVHEWVANLVQHADFSGRDVLITLSLERTEAGYRVAIADTSAGFDFEERLEQRRRELTRLPERGMGLLMVHAAATDIRYERDGTTNTLSFYVLDDGGDRCLDIPF